MKERWREKKGLLVRESEGKEGGMREKNHIRGMEGGKKGGKKGGKEGGMRRRKEGVHRSSSLTY